MNRVFVCDICSKDIFKNSISCNSCPMRWCADCKKHRAKFAFYHKERTCNFCSDYMDVADMDVTDERLYAFAFEKLGIDKVVLKKEYLKLRRVSRVDSIYPISCAECKTKECAHLWKNIKHIDVGCKYLVADHGYCCDCSDNSRCSECIDKKIKSFK